VGVEVENLLDGADVFTRSQYIKTALIWANLSARDSLLDLNLTGHAQVATYADGHLGRKSDPLPGGPWDWVLFAQHLQGIRRDARISEWWGVQRWNGGRPLVELELY
jgi:N-acetyl-anhydromuramyl-L-alanine amidase AmpD